MSSQQLFLWKWSSPRGTWDQQLSPPTAALAKKKIHPGHSNVTSPLLGVGGRAGTPSSQSEPSETAAPGVKPVQRASSTLVDTEEPQNSLCPQDHPELPGLSRSGTAVAAVLALEQLEEVKAPRARAWHTPWDSASPPLTSRQ